MRFIPVKNLSEGMLVGKPLFNHSGHILIQAGVALTENAINKLKMLDYAGLYIRDAFSEDIEVENVISYETRSKAAQSIRKIMTTSMVEKSRLFQGSLKEIKDILDKIIDEIMNAESSIVNIIDMKDFDEYTYQHSINVCVLACVIGLGYEMKREQLQKLALAAILHDIGKMFIDIALINKPGKLTPEEFDIMKTHTLVGVEKLELRRVFPSVVTASILQHHEKYDGSGYPYGRNGTQIPLNAQIISMVDVYDALTTKRPYRQPLPPSEAYEYVLGNAGQAFNPNLVQIFKRKIAPFPLGMQVRLSNGEHGIVYKNYEGNLMRPMIKLSWVKGQQGDRFLDLQNDSETYNITVEKIFL